MTGKGQHVNDVTVSEIKTDCAKDKEGMTKRTDRNNPLRVTVQSAVKKTMDQTINEKQTRFCKG